MENHASTKTAGDKSDVIFKKMTRSGVRNQNSDFVQADTESMTNLCENCDFVDLNSIDSNSYMDNASIDTASIDNNFCHDSLSADNLSINVSIDSHEVSESTLDLREITQSILDLEGTQILRNRSEYGTSTELQGITQVPSSPPPSYEHVLAEARLAQQVAFAGKENEQKEDEEVAAGGSDSANDEPEYEEPAATPPAPKKGIEIMHKSHKEFYRAVAKQWGITCKMSDHCRCLDCQSMYFDCEYDYNEQEKTDGGLGAGTPMFISEVMHGTACNLL